MPNMRKWLNATKILTESYDVGYEAYSPEFDTVDQNIDNLLSMKTGPLNSDQLFKLVNGYGARLKVNGQKATLTVTDKGIEIIPVTDFWPRGSTLSEFLKDLTGPIPVYLNGSQDYSFKFYSGGVDDSADFFDFTSNVTEQDSEPDVEKIPTCGEDVLTVGQLKDMLWTHAARLCVDSQPATVDVGSTVDIVKTSGKWTTVKMLLDILKDIPESKTITVSGSDQYRYDLHLYAGDEKQDYMNFTPSVGFDDSIGETEIFELDDTNLEFEQEDTDKYVLPPARERGASDDEDEKFNLLYHIEDYQDRGLSAAKKSYSVETLREMPIEVIRKIHDLVMGDDE